MNKLILNQGTSKELSSKIRELDSDNTTIYINNDVVEDTIRRHENFVSSELLEKKDKFIGDICGFSIYRL